MLCNIVLGLQAVVILPRIGILLLKEGSHTHPSTEESVFTWENNTHV